MPFNDIVGNLNSVAWHRANYIDPVDYGSKISNFFDSVGSLDFRSDGLFSSLLRYNNPPLSSVSSLFGSGVNHSDNPSVNNTANYHSPSTPQVLQYIDAPYAEKYGMSAETAYQEALANTAHQREVADLKAAGLNPVLGISGSGAGGVYGASQASSSSSSFGSSGSGKSTSDLAAGATKLSYWVPVLANGIANTVATVYSGNGLTGYAAGMIAQNLASGVLGAIRNHG